VLTDVVRAGGSREWVLVMQNNCYIYSAHARLAAGRVADMSEMVERVLASPPPVPGCGGVPTGSQGRSSPAH
jgi:hypothetical protein